MTDILLVKLTSMGDIVHALPALTEAHAHHPDVRFDWLVDADFADIPAWHPAVRHTLTVPLRRWKRQRRGAVACWQAWRKLRQRSYDLILDSQGLWKSALWACSAKGHRTGFDTASCREPGAARCYHTVHTVPRDQHAIWRQRALFGMALQYTPNGTPDHGLRDPRAPHWQRPLWAEDTQPHVVWITGASWLTKRWPISHWHALSQHAEAAGFKVWVIADPSARATAQAITCDRPHTHLAPPATLTELAHLIATSCGVITPDTGLGHLAAALGIPTVCLFGPTQPGLTAPLGRHVRACSAPGSCPHMPCMRPTCALRAHAPQHSVCMAHHVPQDVWSTFAQLLHTHGPT